MPRELRKHLAAVPPAASLHPTASIPWLRKVMMLDPETKVASLAFIWMLPHYLQHFLGPRRSRTSHWLVQYGAMVTFYSPIPIAACTVSTVLSSRPIKLAFTTTLCSCLLWVSTTYVGSVMTAYTLSTRPFQFLRVLSCLLHLAWSHWDYFFTDRKWTPLEICDLIVASSFLLHAIFLSRPIASELEPKTKAFADCMSQESKSNSPFFDGNANSLQQGCKYPFNEKDGQWVTIQDVLRECNQLLRGTMDPDIFLSYSFCHLLARRYFGFHCAEEGNAEVRDFALKHLLTDYKRAFTIVEVQLTFLHDIFFTRYNPYISLLRLHSIHEARIVCLILSVVGYAVPFFVCKFVEPLKDQAVSHALGGATTVLYSYIFVYPVLPKYWYPIRNALKYYPTATGRTPSTPVLERYAVTLAGLTQRNQRTNLLPQSYWRNKLGQYSLIKDYDSHSYKKAFLAWFEERMLSHESHSFIKHHPVEEDDISVPDSVRRLVALTLRGTNGPPTNGTRSFRRNKNMVPHDLTWTCRQDTHTHTILIWHIATCYLDMVPLEETGETSNHEVASTLSKYCAYLVAFLPDFLPEQSLTTKIIFQQVLQETKDLLGSAQMSMEEKHMRIQGIELPVDEDRQTTFQKGVRLGRQLKELDPLVLWKVMAEFWAETILYVAPSDNAAVHIERLAKGGEFVTHLWAMLSNAGILKRATEQWTPPQPVHVVGDDSDIVREQQDMPQPGPGASDSDIVRPNLRLRRSKSLTTISGSSRNTRA